MPRLGYKGVIWAIAHCLCRLMWKILHDGISYIERGTEASPQAKKRRAQKLTQALRKLGFQVTLNPLTPTAYLRERPPVVDLVPTKPAGQSGPKFATMKNRIVIKGPGWHTGPETDDKGLPHGSKVSPNSCVLLDTQALQTPIAFINPDVEAFGILVAVVAIGHMPSILEPATI
jgi:hypothetical protein